jgi:hypothetical protein
VLTVGLDAARVESTLSTGGLNCPDCGGVLRPWGWARRRFVRDLAGSLLLVRPRRSRCGQCAQSHVLLPVSALLRRADAISVIGAALIAAAAGAGARRAAELVGRPMETVRGWLRRFRARAEQIRVVFTALLIETAPDPIPPAATGSGLADAVAAIVATATAVRSRWPDLVGELPVWMTAAAVSHGRLLAPHWPPIVSSERN